MVLLRNTAKQVVNTKQLHLNVLKSRSPIFTLPFSIGNNKEVQIPIYKISYIEANGVLSKVHLFDQKDNHLSIAMSIGECEQILKSYAFIRVHRSYLVNYSFIKNFKIDSDPKVHLDTNESLPLSRRRKKGVLNYVDTLSDKM